MKSVVNGITLARGARWVGAALVAASIAVAANAAPNLVTNGSFETGDLTGWTQTGNSGFTGVICPGPPMATDGDCLAYAGPIGSIGSLEQELPTLPGYFYIINFAWGADGGSIPSSFSVSFDGVTLFSIANVSTDGVLSSLSFVARATSPSTTLQFGFQDDPDFLYLDAVSVTVPEPPSLVLLGLGLVALRRGQRRKLT